MRIHCVNKTVIRTNHFFLACASKFLRTLLSSSSESYDLICPGFEPTAVEKVLALVSGQPAYLDPEDTGLYNQISFILCQLKIEIKLPPMFNSGHSKADTCRDTIPSLSKLGKFGKAIDLSYLTTMRRYNAARASAYPNLSNQESSSEALDDHMNPHFGTIEPGPSTSNGRLDQGQRPNMDKHIRRLFFDVDEIYESRPATVTSMPAIKTELHDSGFEQYLASFCSSDSSPGVTTREDSSRLDVADGENDSELESSSEDDVQMSETETTDKASSRIVSNLDLDWFECHICPQKTTNYADIALHVGRNHFKENLETFYHPTRGNTCRDCIKMFISEFELDIHVVHFHRAVEKFVPSVDELRMKKKFDNVEPSKLVNNRKPNFMASNPGSSKEERVQVLVKQEPRDETVNEEKDDQDDLQSQPKRIRIGVKTDKLSAGTVINHKRRNKERGPQVRTSDQKIDCHQCPQCHVKTQRLHNLKRHFAMVHRKQDLIRFVGESGVDCTLCRRIFSSTATLIGHLSQSHDIIQDPFLSDKEKSSRNKDATQEHAEGVRAQVQARGEKPSKATKRVHRCETCGEDFSKQKYLLGHMGIKHFKAELMTSFNKEDKSCQVCTELGRRKDQNKLIKHLAIEHQGLNHHLSGNGPTVKRKLACHACGKSFQKACGLRIHEKRCLQ